MKKKLLSFALCGILLMGMTACGSTKTEDPGSTTQVTNDSVYDVSEQEMTEKTGIDLPAPENAVDVKYNIICASDEHPIAEMEFTLDGVAAFERAQFTSLTNIAVENPDASAQEIMSAISDAEWNISGLHYSWDNAASTMVSYCDGWIYSCKEAGLICWLDAAPGILYNIGVAEKTDYDTLQKLADTAFVPMQGEADGDVSA